MIVATFPDARLTAADGVPGSRTIAGVAVPWNTPGRVSSGETVIFHPGSLDAAARPVALRDHDRTRPIGVVADAQDNGAAMVATIRVSATGEGNDALTLANDGALPMLSVGAEPTQYRYDADGTLHVTAADWQELSLLTFGAYPGARVSTVTATTPGGPVDPTTTLTASPDDPTTPPDPDDPTTPPPDPDAEPNPDIEPDVQTRLPGIVPVTAGRAPAVVRASARHPYAGVGMRELAGLISAAATSGDRRIAGQVQAIVTSPGARAPSLQAALADVTLVGTDNVGAGFRPAYQAELIDIVSHGAPLVDLLRQGDLQRGDYPNVTFNAWTKLPQVALQTAEKDEINSTPISMGPTAVPVQTWATGNDLSQQLLDFGSPSFVEDYIRAAGIDYAEVIQLYAATMLWTVATNVPTVAGDDIVTVVGKLIGALDPAKVPPGGLFLGVSWDAWAGAIGMKSDDGPAFWSGTVSFGQILPTANMGGLTVVYLPGLPAGSYLLGLRNAATWYDLPGTPFSLRAINVGQLGLDVAVYGYGACGVQYPYALVKTTVPAA